jgi:hypothetical protein
MPSLCETTEGLYDSLDLLSDSDSDDLDSPSGDSSIRFQSNSPPAPHISEAIPERQIIDDGQGGYILDTDEQIRMSGVHDRDAIPDAPFDKQATKSVWHEIFLL